MRVTDDEILDAQKLLSEKSGLFAEPAGAAAFAGFNKVKETLDKDAVITLVITGNGLKDVDNAKKRINMPEHHIKSIDELINI